MLLVLALANGFYLYLFPAQAETDYAWSITPPINAAMLGAGYLGGAVATVLGLITPHWRSARVVAASLVVLSIALLGATLIHEDRFRWDYAPTWLWTFVYAGAPIAIVLLGRMQEGRSHVPAADPRLRTMRIASFVTGVPFLLLGLALYLAPTDVGGEWPWALTPLLARAAAGWYLLVATVLLLGGVAVRRAREVAIPYGTAAAWCVAMLLLPLLHSDDLNDASSTLPLFIALHALTLAVCVYALVAARRAARAEPAGS